MRNKPLGLGEATMQAQVAAGIASDGGGGMIWVVPSVPQAVRVK
jgi:hypothetical protein